MSLGSPDVVQFILLSLASSFEKPLSLNWSPAVVATVGVSMVNELDSRDCLAWLFLHVWISLPATLPLLGYATFHKFVYILGPGLKACEDLKL